MKKTMIGQREFLDPSKPGIITNRSQNMKAGDSTTFMQISIARSKTASTVLATAELECARLGGRAARSLCQNSAKLRRA